MRTNRARRSIKQSASEKPYVTPSCALADLPDDELLDFDAAGAYTKRTGRRFRETFINSGELPVVELSPRRRYVRAADLRALIHKRHTQQAHLAAVHVLRKRGK